MMHSYTEDCMRDFIDMIYKWSKEGLESQEISMLDLVMVANHIEDLEMELSDYEENE